MIKRIAAGELRIGMFVHDLNCSWVDHPFLFNRVRITSARDLERLLQTGVTHVYIDTTLGADSQPGNERESIEREISIAMNEAGSRGASLLPNRPLGEELQRARNIHRETQALILQLFGDARLGKAPDLERIEPLVERIGLSLAANAGALLMLTRMKDADQYTFQHSVAVGLLLMRFASAAGYGADEVARIGIGGLVHDIGKMFTPDSILNKPGRLTPAEFDLIKRHPGDGHQLLSKARGVQQEQLDITRQHHERMDGRGYPDSRTASEIPAVARMAAIVDVYDALTSDRCYHRGIPPTLALRRLVEWSGEHFDTELVHRFVQCIGIYPTGTVVELVSGRIAIVTDQTASALLAPKLLAVYDSKKRRTLVPTEISPDGSGQLPDLILGVTVGSKWGITPEDFL